MCILASIPALQYHNIVFSGYILYIISTANVLLI